ncbi:ATP-dependent nuclease [Chromobacterium haemolyticum]|uniref:ATP-dependent nuclease n=1 Tax=Chromobacterium haemolyticum TaxID=394935 RepID=UPI000D2F94EC|nr:AAA family ATPase [Chromobacterium haemolyticum]PTU68824.1 hypothetical protein DBB33_04915 [Chromobacterium haemolyticum]
MAYSEIRETTITELLEKVRRHDYGKYLLKASIGKIRGFSNEDISFEFPVTALIGPNGSGKSAVLGAAGCAYKMIKPGMFFPKSAIGDDSMSGWKVEYEIIDKELSARQLVKRTSNFRQAKWVRSDVVNREVLFFGIERTVPAGEKVRYKQLKRSTYVHRSPLNVIAKEVADQVEHILGKSVSRYETTLYGFGDSFLVGKDGVNAYSEFHFGAGESSIIRMVSKIESASPNSLILIEEIENGLHPVATQRMVEYLIDVAKRKSIQTIFTTHSDYALDPLPNEAIWASVGGALRQGRLTVEALRAVNGRVEKKLAIFVEDVFAKNWVSAILREKLGYDFDQLEIHAAQGDGNARKIHLGHIANPAVNFKSLCVLDGDSACDEDLDNGIIKLPGGQPELTVFQRIRENLVENIALLTVSCHKSHENQQLVSDAIAEVASANRDPHVIFSQIGLKIGFVSEEIVRGAFLSLWVYSNQDYCNQFAQRVRDIINTQ